MKSDLENRITALAACQHGVVTRRQLIELGLSRSAVYRRRDSGQLHLLHRGVYLVGPLLPPGALELAAVLASGPGSVVSHCRAASLWGPRPTRTAASGRRGSGAGLAWYARAAGSPCAGTAWHAGGAGSGHAAAKPVAGSEPVDVTVVRAHGGHRPGIRRHLADRLGDEEWTILDGIPVTTPTRTLVDLASMVGTRELEEAVARAEREGLLDREGLSASLARHRRRRGTTALRAVLEAEGGPALTRSEGDRRKDAWLLAAGIHVLRLSWRQITHEAMATAVQIGQALARAAAGRPG